MLPPILQRDPLPAQPVDIADQASSVDLWSFGPAGSRVQRLVTAEVVDNRTFQMAHTAPLVAFVHSEQLHAVMPGDEPSTIETEQVVLSHSIDSAETMGRRARCSYTTQDIDFPDEGDGAER